MGRLAILVLLVALAACEGPVGPSGPTGEPGPGTRWVHTGTVSSSGSASVDLPSAAGTIDDPPAVTCYISDEGNTWIVIAADASNTTCGVGDNGSGGLFVAIVRAPAFWFWRTVVIY